MDQRVARASLSHDTAPEVEAAQVHRWSTMSAADKAHLIVGLCQAADAFALAGIRHRYPSASEREVFLRFAILRLGRDLASRVYTDASHLSD
jgi:hypothetical protein